MLDTKSKICSGVGLDVADYDSYIDVSDLLMLVIHLEDKENGCSPTELEGALCRGGHKHALCDEFPQVVKGNVLHVEGMLYRAESDVPKVETILAVESVPRYGTLAGELQEYPVEVECGHLKEYAVNMHKRKMMYKLTLDAADDNTRRIVCG